MDAKKIKERIYGLYQLDWMQQHGWTVKDIVYSLQELILEDDEETDIEEFLSKAIYSFENDYGFRGTSEIYDNYEEFFSIDGLYREKDYIHSLCIRIDEMELYKEYLIVLEDEEILNRLTINDLKYA